MELHAKLWKCTSDGLEESHRIVRREGGRTDPFTNSLGNLVLVFFGRVRICPFRKYSSFVTEAGDVEKWVGGPNKQRVLDALDKTIEHLEKMKK